MFSARIMTVLIEKEVGNENDREGNTVREKAGPKK